MKKWKIVLTVEAIMESEEKPDCQELYEDLHDVANAMERMDLPGQWWQVSAEELVGKTAIFAACEEVGVDPGHFEED